MLRDHRDHKVIGVVRVWRVFRVPMVQWAQKVNLAIVVFRVYLDRREQLGIQDHQGHKDFMVLGVYRAELVLLANQEFPVSEDCLVPMENPVNRDHRVFKVYLDQLVCPVIRVSPVNRVKMVRQVLLVRPAQGVMSGKRVFQDHLDHLDHQDMMVNVVLLDQLEPEAFRVYPVNRVLQEAQVRMVNRVQLDIQDHLD